MTPEQIGMVEGPESLVSLCLHVRRMSDSQGDQIDADRLSRCADLLEAQTAELATLRAKRDAVVEQCAVACDKIAGNTADFSRDHRRAAGQCAAMIRALKGGA